MKEKSSIHGAPEPAASPYMTNSPNSAARLEAFCKPPVNRSEQVASLLHLALVTPEAREAHCGAEFPGCERTLEIPGQVHAAQRAEREEKEREVKALKVYCRPT